MASYEDFIAGLDRMSEEDRRRTLDHLNQTLGGDGYGDNDDQDGAIGAGPSNYRGAPAAAAAPDTTGGMPGSRLSNADSFGGPPLRKLRLFSGRIPVLSAETDFDKWFIQSQQLVDDDMLWIQSIVLVDIHLLPSVWIC
jgi:hypothetical protein